MKSGVALVLALAIVAVPIAIHAGGQPHMIFSSVGIGRSQTARLNITNIANAESTRAGHCDVTLGFVDDNNQMLVPAVQVTVRGSHSTHIDINISNPDLRPGRNVRVRPVVGVLPDGAGACDSIVGSVEIFDNATGATRAVVNPLVYSGFNPQPDIPGFVGIPGGQ